jgi:hypothetical protein
MPTNTIRTLPLMITCHMTRLHIDPPPLSGAIDETDFFGASEMRIDRIFAAGPSKVQEWVQLATASFMVDYQT